MFWIYFVCVCFVCLFVFYLLARFPSIFIHLYLNLVVRDKRRRRRWKTKTTKKKRKKKTKKKTCRNGPPDPATKIRHEILNPQEFAQNNSQIDNREVKQIHGGCSHCKSAFFCPKIFQIFNASFWSTFCDDLHKWCKEAENGPIIQWQH